MKDALLNGLYVIIGIMSVVSLSLSMYFTKDYDTKLTATKVNEYNVNANRNVVGYVNTGHGECAVYDEPTNYTPVYTTYQYTYNDEVYQFTMNTPFSQKDEIDIWIDSNNPAAYVEDTYKPNISR